MKNLSFIEPIRVVVRITATLKKIWVEIFERVIGCSNEDTTWLTLIYPAHFEDVPFQSGVNHIFEG